MSQPLIHRTLLSHYLKLAIADCEFSQTNALVTINMPIVRQAPDWRLYDRRIHRKLSYKGQVCDLQVPARSTISCLKQEKHFLINRHLLQYFNVFKYQLCTIPPYVKESSHSLSCVVGQFERKSVSQITKSCAFCCCTDTRLIINQIE